MIHQELMPFPDLTVAENIFMGCEPASSLLGWIDRDRRNSVAGRLLEKLGASWSPGTPMRELTVAEMQTVENAKALAHRAAILIMDEPTSALSDRELDRLLDQIGDLNGQGVAIIYISHRLEEVFRIADRVTVLRDGRDLGTHAVSELDRDRLIGLMVGRELGSARAKAPAVQGEVVLTMRSIKKTPPQQNLWVNWSGSGSRPNA
jgi:inositol transport system ATP-binding protein